MFPGNKYINYKLEMYCRIYSAFSGEIKYIIHIVFKIIRKNNKQANKRWNKL